MEKDYNLAIRGNEPNARGTIHPTAISRGFSLPLDPTSYKKMYKQRKANIAVFRGCKFDCCYCAFRNTLRFNTECPECLTFSPHVHWESPTKTPPKTKDGEFITIGLNGDISFATDTQILSFLRYCREWGDRNFMIQTKDPRRLCGWNRYIPKNVTIGTTIESDYPQLFKRKLIEPKIVDNRIISDYELLIYSDISKAPFPEKRYEAMQCLRVHNKIALTIEPILEFDIDKFIKWIKVLTPLEYLWIGYDSKPEINHLPEPPLAKTQDFIKRLADAGISVHQKLIRKAWYER
ncbi:MAG: hypothetical protein V1854_04820 [Methanobacteriota archaeon]